MSRFRILTHKADYGRFLDVLIVQERPEGSFVAKPIEFVSEDHTVWPEPSIAPVQCRTILHGGDVKVDKLDGQAFLQACMDAAWEIGMRPSGLFDHTAEIGAVKRHLEDMRALVFKGPKP